MPLNTLAPSGTGALAGLVLLSGLLTAGCTSQPEVPEAEFASTRQSIQQAEQANAMQFAGSEMLAAERKLQQAIAANQNGEPQTARFLLEEARLHAEQAAVSARRAEAEQSLAEIEAGLTELRRELNDGSD